MRRGGWWALGLFILVGVGLPVGQWRYVRWHMPKVAAAVEAADAEGPAMLDRIGTPSGAKPYSEQEKRYGTRGRRSMWRGVTSSITWRQEFQVPGDFAAICEWYSKRLQGDGWVSFDDMPPSTVQREFKRGDWFVKVGNRAFFTHPVETRIQLELTWDYWARKD